MIYHNPLLWDPYKKRRKTTARIQWNEISGCCFHCSPLKKPPQVRGLAEAVDDHDGGGLPRRTAPPRRRQRESLELLPFTS